MPHAAPAQACAPRALIADDEPLLRSALARLLAEAWPELQIVAEARNGREAVEQFEAHAPDICFLDVQMPGLSGVEAAQRIGGRAHLVFVTAFQQYALEAFERGVLDYLVKPVQPARLAETVQRLKARMQPAAAVAGLAGAPALQDLLAELAARLAAGAGASGPARAEPLRWLRAGVGQALRLIAVEEIDYFRSDEKYTLVAFRGDDGRPAEALLRQPLKELLPQLDARQFVQVHRSVVVNLRAVQLVRRGENETAEIQLKGRPEVLPVSRTYLHLFKAG